MPIEELDTKLQIKKVDGSENFLKRVAKVNVMRDTKLRGNDLAVKRKKVEEKIDRALLKKTPWLLDKMFELAEGLYILDKHDPGRQIRYYKIIPDRQAIAYLMDRAIGKPKEEGNGNDESKKGLLMVESIIKTLANGEKEKRIRAGATGQGIPELGQYVAEAGEYDR